MIKLRTGLLLGDDSPIRVNCNVGCNKESDYESEINKLRLLKAENILPDMMMDLSLAKFDNPLYLNIRDELNLPFGTVLSYQMLDRRLGLQWEYIRDMLIKLCEDGISFITVHFTADNDLLERAKKTRKIPMTSRGGGIILYDTILNHRGKNIFRNNIEEICNIALKYDVVISIGTTFRPATIFDACDEIQVEETKRQLEICKYLQNKGVNVMVENVGHISLNKLQAHAKLLKQFNAPIMPLGPLPTDSAVNQDHIANAIGGTFAAYLGVANVINCVTRYEHSQSTITPEVTIEAIQSARLAAHIADLAKNIPSAVHQDSCITEQRTKLNSCFADGTNCTRCSFACPLKLLSND